MEIDEKAVCVTRGTGFIASCLIRRPLEHGYSVRTTVRSDPEKTRDLSFLTNLPGASEKLQIFNADINDPDSFEAAIEGCTGVLHVASPMDFEARETEQVQTQRTISGTLGILKTCLKYCKTVKRVVYTSSASAVVFNRKNVDIMDESFWSESGHVRSPYVNSYMNINIKTLTEKAALQFAEETGLDLVTVNPTYVVGPFICPKLPDSLRTVLAMILGNKDDYSYILNAPMVHVDDVARAHIFLLEHPEAKGRYNCSSEALTIQQMSEFLSAKYP